MTLTPQLSHGRSEFNPFLFASVGEDEAGVDITVLSALARLGFDPWGEAARLADLPKEAATQALTATIALLPLGNWKAADVRDIAVRLIDSLPRRGIPFISSVRSTAAPQEAGTPKVKAGLAIWVICGVVAIGWFFVASYLESDQPFERAPSAVTTTSP